MSIDLRRQVDLDRGRLVTRIVVRRVHQRGGKVVTSYRSPATLRKLQTHWADVAASVASEPQRSVTAGVVPDPQVPVGSSPYAQPGSDCVFTATGSLPALPAIVDCAEPKISLHGKLVVLESTVPSASFSDGGKGPSTTIALDVLRSDAEQPRWERLASGFRGYTRSGLLEWCATDRGIAMLEGDVVYPDEPSEPLTLRWVAAERPSAGWSGAVPQLNEMQADGGTPRLACSGTSVFAAYSSWKPSAKDPGLRFVRFLPPR